MTLLLSPAADRVQTERSPSHGGRPAELARSFAYTAAAGRTFSAFRSRATIVRLDSIGNDVLGVPRWVPFGEVWAHPGMRRAGQWLNNPVIEVADGDDPRLVLATGTPVALFGIDNHRHAYARAVIDHLRTTCRTVLVVDMGRSLRDLVYADVATFGADDERGAALVDLLTGEPVAA